MIWFVIKDTMKKVLIFAVTAAIAFVAYSLFNAPESAYDDLLPPDSKDPESHHMTDVFSKAKQYAAHQADAGEV